MKTRKPRYQNGSIRKVKTAKDYVWEVRFSDYKDGKRHQRTQRYDPAQYPTEKSVRKAIELTVSQLNSGTGGEKADPKFLVIANLYRKEHLPELDHSTQSMNQYLLTRYIEAEYGHTRLRDIKPLAVERWLKNLNLAPTTRRSIRSILSVCFHLAAKYEFISAFENNPMRLVKVKGVTKRQKPKVEITVEQFKLLLANVPEPLNIMVLLDGAYGLRISELLALKWEDIDAEKKIIYIRRKFTRGKLGDTKTDASNAPLPIAQPILDVLTKYKPKTEDSEWLFPSPRTGGPRSASMLLQKGLKPIARELGLGNIGFHSLRHACRSWLSSGGVDLSTTKDLLRHSDISTTMNVYGKALTEDMRKAHEELVKKILK